MLLPSYLQEYLKSCNVERRYSTQSTNQKKTKTCPVRAKSFETSSYPTVLRNVVN